MTPRLEDRPEQHYVAIPVRVPMAETGHPAELEAVTRELLEWAETGGVRWQLSNTPDGEQWAARLEYYLTDPAEEQDMTAWRTELAFLTAD